MIKLIIFWKKISDFKIFSLLKIFLHENHFLNFSVSCVSASCVFGELCFGELCFGELCFGEMWGRHNYSFL